MGLNKPSVMSKNTKKYHDLSMRCTLDREETCRSCGVQDHLLFPQNKFEVTAWTLKRKMWGE